MITESIRSFCDLWGYISFIYLCIRRQRRRQGEGRRGKEKGRKEIGEEGRGKGRKLEGKGGKAKGRFFPVLYEVVFRQ